MGSSKKQEKRLTEPMKKLLEKQGYRFTGKNSAIKVCDWTKRSLRGEDVCYKGKFYGIQTWRCVQMTPCLTNCNHACIFCWRSMNVTIPKKPNKTEIDEPKQMVENAIREHVKYLIGFGGNKKRNMQRFEEAKKPKHFAISLAGEPSYYPKLAELIQEVHSRRMTTFLVTNGTNPEALLSLKKKNALPTQLYVTLPAPDEATYRKTCRPLVKNSWKNILKTLKLLKKLDCRKAIRFTLVKGYNMISPEVYAKIIKDIDTDFFELKAYMCVGSSRERLSLENMPLHSEITAFAEKVGIMAGMKIVDESVDSRVVLLMNPKNRLCKNRQLKLYGS